MIGADAEAAIAQLFGNPLQAAEGFVKAIEKNEIIAATMHLGELDFHLAYCFEFRNPRAFGSPSLQSELMRDFVLLTAGFRLFFWFIAAPQG